MKYIYLFLFLFTVQFTYSQSVEFSKQRIIVQLNNSEQINSIEQLREINALQFLDLEFSIKNITLLDQAISNTSLLNNRPMLIEFNEEINVTALIDRLNDTSLFTFVEPDYINYGSGIKQESVIQDEISEGNSLMSPFITMPNDQFFFRQWSLNNNGTFNLSPSIADADIDMVEAWDMATGNPNITMAVLDSGLRMSHPEYSGRLWTNPNESTNGNDSDNNSYVDDINGWDFVNEDNDPTDDHGHGTNVAGIATATGNNSIGYAGVDWSCKVMILKVLNDNNSGFTSDIIESFYYAISHDVKVISISIGGSGFSMVYQNAIDAAYNNGITVVACMMNFNNDTPYYPAAFANTIAVGSTDSNDERTEPFFWSNTSGSNYGSHIDIVAPGNYMYGLSAFSDTNYNSYWGGTSQATPLVSGIASLMLFLDPSLSPDDIRAILRNTAEDQVGDAQDTPGWDQYYGAGRVNANDALEQTLSVKDFELNGIELYPVPVMDVLFISNGLIIKSYNISSISGQQIKSGNVINNSIDCSQLSQGIYFVELTSSEDTTIVKKIIKQ